MKHLIRKKSFFDAETPDPKSMTVQGAALSVEELYKKLVVGAIDAAGYVHPIEYDDSPDIDNPDPLNTFGLEVGEVEERISEQIEIAKNEMKRTKKQGEGAKPSPEPLKQEAQPSGDDGK